MNLRLRKILCSVIGILGVVICQQSIAMDFNTTVPLQEKGAVTYYVNSQIEGFGDTEMMVDTGSGYVALNERTIKMLRKQGLATYTKTIDGVMADGSRRNVKIYRIEELNIGGVCIIRDVEAAMLPGKTRNILGLSALKRTSPFALSMSPPQLMLSNCSSGST